VNWSTLGDVLGAGEVHSRRLGESHREYRGTFGFRAQDTPTIARLFESAEVVEYEGQVDLEHKCLKVIVTDVSFDNGIAYFMGRGEPYPASGGRASGEA
jgi:hypothetical protein